MVCSKCWPLASFLWLDSDIWCHQTQVNHPMYMNLLSRSQLFLISDCPDTSSWNTGFEYYKYTRSWLQAPFPDKLLKENNGQSINTICKLVVKISTLKNLKKHVVRLYNIQMCIRFWHWAPCPETDTGTWCHEI